MATKNYEPKYLPYGLLIQRSEKEWFYSGKSGVQFRFIYEPTFMSSIDAHGPQYRAQGKQWNPILHCENNVREIIVYGYDKSPELAGLEIEARIIDEFIFGKAFIPAPGTWGEEIRKCAIDLYKTIKASYINAERIY